MIIALKGLIGSGKSSISKVLEAEHNFKVINCDKIVHELYENEQDLVNQIKEALKIEVFDRKEIGKIVFSNPEKLKILEQIVHPRLQLECQKIIKNNKNIVLDCQIIEKLTLSYDLVLIAVADKNTLIKRVMKRDDRTQSEVEDIINLQEQGYLLDKRTYTIDTTHDYYDILEKILRSYNGSKDWENSKHPRN